MLQSMEAQLRGLKRHCPIEKENLITWTLVSAWFRDNSIDLQIKVEELSK